MRFAMMIASHVKLIVILTLSGCTFRGVALVQRKRKLGARRLLWQHRGENVTRLIQSAFAPSHADSTYSSHQTAEGTNLSERKRRAVAARNITANTTRGAIRQTFLSTGAMRHNLILGMLLFIGVAVFEVVHFWTSGIDFRAHMSGMQEVQSERQETSPLTGAMRIWGRYIAQDTTYALSCIALLIGLVFLKQYVGVLIVTWIGVFWDQVAIWCSDAVSLAQVNRATDNPKASLYALLLEFFFFTSIAIAAVAYEGYLLSMFAVRVRSFVTIEFAERWMNDFAYYHLLLPGVPSIGARNPDQRIQEDIELFVDRSLTLALGFITQPLQFCLFSGIVYSLSPEFVLGMTGVRCPGWLVYASWVYALIATFLVVFITSPLEVLSYYKERVEADFRWELASVRSNAEQIAFARGEDVVLEQSRNRFDLIRRCIWEIMIVQKRYTIITEFFSQGELISSFIFLGPSLLAGQVTLGTVQSGQRAINKITNALLWYAFNYESIVKWRATTARLVRFQQAMDERPCNHNNYRVDVPSQSSDKHMSCENLTIWAPKDSTEVSLGAPQGTRTLLLESLNFSVLPGQRILLSGPSGGGKTAFLRTLLGAWPFVDGELKFGVGVAKSMIFSSTVYLPVGQLRSVVAYPLHPQECSDEDIEVALQVVGLDSLLSEGLDRETDWSKCLSDGQKSRISFARLVLHKPMFAAMDEPLAHLDEASQAKILKDVVASLPEAASLLVVEHGVGSETLAFFNTQYLLDMERKTFVTMM